MTSNEDVSLQEYVFFLCTILCKAVVCTFNLSLITEVQMPAPYRIIVESVVWTPHGFITVNLCYGALKTFIF